jgi:NIPSNAP protein
MIYEFRSYQAAPGRLRDLDDRFRDLTTRVFTRLGFDPIGFWTAENPDRLVYLLRWADQAERDGKWKEFGADAEWQEGKAASERNGPLLTGTSAEIWTPTSYSQLS